MDRQVRRQVGDLRSKVVRWHRKSQRLFRRPRAARPQENGSMMKNYDNDEMTRISLSVSTTPAYDTRLLKCNLSARENLVSSMYETCRWLAGCEVVS